MREGESRKREWRGARGEEEGETEGGIERGREKERETDSAVPRRA